jgi:3-isopropylmalate/(R)-2-methylmalate dehydratase large subunit
MGKTFAEKILAAKADLDEVIPSQIVTVKPDYIMSHDNSAAISDKFKAIGLKKVFNPEQIVIVLDHCVPPADEKYSKNHQKIRNFVKDQELPYFFDINTGICHQVLPEKGFVFPGALILGSDSHTTTYGAFGAFSAGIGRSEAAAIWATGEMWLMVPESYKIEIKGKFRQNTSAKDLILKIIGEIGADGALYKSVEFTGEGIEDMSIDSRMILTNMAAEMGAKNGYMKPDNKTENWLKDRVRSAYIPIVPDDDAVYEKILTFDLENLDRQIACPHTVDNVKPVEELKGTKIDQALIGTCTNGRMEDLREAAEILKGNRVASSVRLLVLPASYEIYKDALKEGLIEIFIDAGAVIINPGCGPCLGAHEGVPAPGEKVISTANRNFKGRMGSPESEIYLASPYTVAKAAITGVIE